MAEMDSWEGEEKKSNTGKILLIVGLVGCGGILVLVLLCGGIGYWFYHKSQVEAPQVQAAAEAFLDAVKANKIDAAYALTTTQYQKTMPKDAFVNYLKAFPVLTQYTSRTVMMTMAFPGDNGAGGATIVMQLHTKKAAQTCQLVLLKEGGAWKVQQMTLQ